MDNKKEFNPNKVAEIVTEQIIKGLEQGHIPWQRPWTISASESGPMNFVTKHEYSGVNILLANLACMSKGYELPLFASFKQINGIGARVRKGESGHIIVFTKTYETTKRETVESEEIEIATSYHMLRYYKVWNIAQIENVPEKYIPKHKAESKVNKIKLAEALLHKRKPSIHHQGNEAYYSPSMDSITLPMPEQFKTVQDYYATGYHELVHWTGHKSRLNRFDDTDKAMFGSESYSKEELTAEIGANMLSFHVGIEREVNRNSQAYINGWLKKLKDDSKFVIQAASKAQKAYEYVIN